MKTKVKFIAANYLDDLESKVNPFLEKKWQIKGGG